MILGDNPQRRPLIRKTLKEAAQVIAVSRALAEKAVELGADPEKVHHVPNGVDQKRFSPQDRDEARRELELQGSSPLILFCGKPGAGEGLESSA